MSETETTAQLDGDPYPEPVAVLSLRHCTVYRAVDDDGQPVLLLTDGVTTVAVECGLSGLNPEAVWRAGLLATFLADYAQSVGGALALPVPVGGGSR